MHSTVKESAHAEVDLSDAMAPQTNQKNETVCLLAKISGNFIRKYERFKG